LCFSLFLFAHLTGRVRRHRFARGRARRPARHAVAASGILGNATFGDVDPVRRVLMVAAGIVGLLAISRRNLPAECVSSTAKREFALRLNR
jgi:hypothetical protein